MTHYTQTPFVSTKGLITAKELCKHLDMSWNTVQKYFFHLEDFPKRKVGNKWYFHKEKLEVFLGEYFKNAS